MSDSAATDTRRNLGYLKNTVKHGSIYTLGVVLSRLVGFIMIPIYTRVLTPGDYGILEILSLTTDVFAMLAGFGIGLAVIRYYYRYESEEERNAVVSSACITLVGVFAVAAAIALAFAGPITTALLGPGESVTLVRLAIVAMLLGSTIEIPVAFLRARQRSTVVVTVGVTRLLISLGLNILFVVVLRLGVAGVLYSTILSSGIVGGTLVYRVLRETGIRYSREAVGRLIAYGAPLVVWNLASFVLLYSDRYFLRTYESLSAVGVYSLSYKFAMLIALFVSGPFHDIWVPKALEIEKTEGASASPILRSILDYYNLLLVSVALGVSLFASDVIVIATGSAFHEAAGPVPILAVAMVFFGYRSVSQIGAMIRERSNLIALSTSVAAGVVLLLNFLLIPRFGVTGAALATLGAFMMEFLVMRELSRRVYPLRFELRHLAVPLVLALATWGATTLLVPQGSPLLLSIPAKGVAFVVYAAAVLRFGGLAEAQRRMIVTALRDPVRLVRVLRGA